MLRNNHFIEKSILEVKQRPYYYSMLKENYSQHETKSRVSRSAVIATAIR